MDDFFKPVTDFSGSKGLVFVGDKVLVYRRDINTKLFPKKLDLPGGGRNGQETPFETFAREVYEEFGLTVQRENIVYARQYESSIHEGRKTFFAAAKLPATDNVNIHFGDEGMEYMLLPVQDYLKRTDAWPIFQERAADYLNATESS